MYTSEVIVNITSPSYSRKFWFFNKSDPDLPVLLFLSLFRKKSLLEAIIHGVWGGVDPFVTIYFKFHSLSAFP